MIGMKPVMKPLILFLIGCLVLESCSSIPKSNPVLDKQPEESFTISGEPPFSNQDLSSDQSTTIAYSEASIPASSITLVKEIQDLTALRQADLVPNASGWLHLIDRQFHTKVNPSSTFDDSGGELQLEQWLALDDQGRIRADIRRLLDNQGPAGDFNLLAGGDWINMPLAGFSANSNTLPFDSSYGIFELVTQLIRQGQTLNKSTLYKECWYQGEKYTLTDGQVTHEIVFRPDRHALRWIKTWQVSSGVITLLSSFEIALEERLSQPPDDILALVSQATP